MARINIEDDLYKDRRFFDLIMKLKDPDRALGVLVRAWCVAQKWYLTDSKMIPEKEWKKQVLPEEIFEVGLAERIGAFVYVSGSEQQFAWLEQRVEAGRKGGLKSGRQRKHTTDDAIIEGHHPNKLLSESIHIEANEATASLAEAKPSKTKQNQANATLLTPSPSPSPSLSPSQSSSSNSNSNSNTKKKDSSAGRSSDLLADQPKIVIGRGVATWEGYSSAYKNRYGCSPPRSARTNADMSKLVSLLGEEAAPHVAAFYVEHPDQFYVRNKHPSWLLARDYQKLFVEWSTGNVSTGGSQNMENLKEMARDIAKGKL